MSNTVIDLQISPENLSILLRTQTWLMAQELQAYIVGGMVRDLVLGRDTADIDIAVAGDVLSLGDAMASALGAKAVVLDAVNRIVRLVSRDREDYSGWHIDLSTVRDNLQADLAKRDFTIDAMAIDLNTVVLGNGNPVRAAIIDPWLGLEDIKQKQLRAVDAAIFTADPIRLLRVMRLAAELKFTVSEETEALIRRDAGFIGHAAGERIREELLRLLRLTSADEILVYMQKLGLLTAIIPELEATIGVIQPREHAWDVFNHSLKSIAALDFLVRRGEWPYADSSVLQYVPWNEALEAYFRSPVSALSTHYELLKIAALLHDIAKPQTRVITDSGRIRFFGHPQQGALITLAIMQRLRFSVRELRLVETVVREHLRPVQMGTGELPTRKAVYRYFRDVGDAAIDTLYFSLADHLAARGPDLDLTNWRGHANMVTYMLTESSSEKRVVKPVRLIDGYDLQQELGLQAGPEIGRLLECVREAQAAGEIDNREEALAFIKKLMEQGKK